MAAKSGINRNLGDPVNIRITAADKAALQKLAAENDRTMQQEIRRAIRLYLEGK